MRTASGLREIIWTATFLMLLIVFATRAQGSLFTLYQVQSQDLWILWVLPPALALVTLRPPAWRLPDRPPAAGFWVSGLAGLAVLLGLGTHWLMGDFPLSRDEHMVVFDMAVFDRLRLAAPLAPAWRGYADALVPVFLINPDRPMALVSAYLPMNAVLRLLFSKIADPAFFNPVLVLVGGIALLDIAKREFAQDARAQWVVLLIYALSAQVLVAAMTTYAMTAHMALNLVWLALFLRGGRSGHGGAIAIGLVAVGLHQLVFHPLFVAPFLLWRLLQGQWRIVLVYAIAYAAILGWWIVYPQFVLLETGTSSVVGDATGDFFTARVLPLLLKRDPNTIALMILNLLRFVAWQNLALLPLLVGAAPLFVRREGLAAPLLWGIALLVAVIGFVLPFQGHGWGYRYLQPFFGNAALLSGYGYRRLADRIGARADGIVVALSALTLVFAIPLLCYRAHAFVAPHVALERLIAAQRSDFVVVDTEDALGTDGRWAENAIDHVRNRPDLDNRPLRFSSKSMTWPKIIELCRRGSIVPVTRADQQSVGFATNVPAASPRFAALIAPIARSACLRPLVRRPV